MRAMRPAPISTDGLEVLVQEVMAAMTTLPLRRCTELPCRSMWLSDPDTGRQRGSRAVSVPDSSWNWEMLATSASRS